MISRIPNIQTKKNPTSRVSILANPASQVDVKSPFPVKISCVFPNPTPYFRQILDPENALPDPERCPIQNHKLSWNLTELIANLYGFLLQH